MTELQLMALMRDAPGGIEKVNVLSRCNAFRPELQPYVAEPTLYPIDAKHHTWQLSLCWVNSRIRIFMDINQHSLAGCIAVYYIKDDEDHDTLADKIDLLCGQHPEDSIGRIIYGLWDTDKNGAFDIVQKLLKEIV